MSVSGLSTQRWPRPGASLCQNLQVRGFSLLPVHVAVQLLQSMFDCTFPLCNFHLFLFYDLSLSIDVFCLMQLCHPPFLYSLSTVSFSLGNIRVMAALRIQPPAGLRGSFCGLFMVRFPSLPSVWATPSCFFTALFCYCCRKLDISGNTL